MMTDDCAELIGVAIYERPDPGFCGCYGAFQGWYFDGEVYMECVGCGAVLWLREGR